MLWRGFARRVEKEGEQVWASILTLHFTILRRSKQSRQVNAVNADAPTIDIPCFYTDVCLSGLLVKRPYSNLIIHGTSVALRGVQRSQTARGP